VLGLWAIASWPKSADELWSDALGCVSQVSAFVRAMLYDPEMRLNGGSVIAYDPCPTAATEASLLCTVLDLYSRGALPGGLQDIHDEMVRQQQPLGMSGPPCIHTYPADAVTTQLLCTCAL
jgi:hypothetical protein